MLTVFNILIYLLYAILFAASLLNAIAPRWTWSKFESWKSTKEPSNAYFFVRRLGGILGLFIVTVAVALPLLAAAR